MQRKKYDCAIIGGGLSGLALSIQLAKAGKSVALFEKEEYPFHKVCGEYISNESIPFLESLGLDLSKFNSPIISELFLSSPSGIAIQRKLDIGGRGLSRYHLDEQLYKIAVANGAIVFAKTKVQRINYSHNCFEIHFGNEIIYSRTVAGAYGKNSNIDAQTGRKYTAENEQNLFVAVKHHIRTDFDTRRVEMHNFPNGYCGLSAIENGFVNMSYISRASNLKKAGSIPNMEKQILSSNPFLKKYFDTASFVFEKPLTISHLFFGIKKPVHDQMLMLGDAAGNIAPLSGNGMSMALLSSKLAYDSILGFLSGQFSFDQMQSTYQAAYYSHFSDRIKTARRINSMFVSPALTNWGFRFLKNFPGLIDGVSKQIHGKPF
jgi:menaquinone-9 beta-reductase